MMERSPFDAERDPELGELLREAWPPPRPELFAARLKARLAVLPPRTSQWEVLAGWARPSVLGAALAAGFLLGLVLWQGWRERTLGGGTSVSIAMLEPRAENAVIYAVLEER